MNPIIKERIFKAADTLYETAPAGEFPNVEAVRQLSKAGMNNVVTALKEWRELKQTITQQINTPLPTEFQNTLMVMGHQLWDEAQALAKAAFIEEQAKFDAEKSEWLRLSQEQSEAYEALLAQHETLKKEHTSISRQRALIKQLHDGMIEQRDFAFDERTKLQETLALEKTTLNEAQKEIHTLKGELATVSANLAIAQNQLSELNPLKQALNDADKEKILFELKYQKLSNELDDHKALFSKELKSNVKKIQNHEQSDAVLQKKIELLTSQLANTSGELNATKSQVNDLKTIIQGLSHSVPNISTKVTKSKKSSASHS